MTPDLKRWSVRLKTEDSDVMAELARKASELALKRNGGQHGYRAAAEARKILHQWLHQ